jgi:hypothetical protein
MRNAIDLLVRIWTRSDRVLPGSACYRNLLPATIESVMPVMLHRPMIVYVQLGTLG